MFGTDQIPYRRKIGTKKGTIKMTKEEIRIKKDLGVIKKSKKIQGSFETIDNVIEKFLSVIRLTENWIKYSAMDDKTGKEVTKGRRIKNMIMKEATLLGFEIYRDQFSGDVVNIMYSPKLRELAKKRKVKHVSEK